MSHTKLGQILGLIATRCADLSVLESAARWRAEREGANKAEHEAEEAAREDTTSTAEGTHHD